VLADVADNRHSGMWRDAAALLFVTMDRGIGDKRNLQTPRDA
jgi:hypothetical protein